MYTPSHFAPPDQASVDALLDRHDFATLIAIRNGEPFVTHLPLLPERTASGIKLTGHVAAANPHAESLAAGEPQLAIFHGPHAYISPSWYVNPSLVPTWNYAAVHIYGAPTVLPTLDERHAVVERLAARYEAARETPWRFALGDPLRTSMLNAITAFEIHSTRVEAKFKLSQNRQAPDRAALLAAMRRERADPDLIQLTAHAFGERSE